jgi:hypothetical protein
VVAVAVGSGLELQAADQVPSRLPVRPWVLPDAENSDEGGARDTNEEPDNSGGLVGEVPGYVGEVPGWEAAKSLP